MQRIKPLWVILTRHHCNVFYHFSKQIVRTCTLYLYTVHFSNVGSISTEFFFEYAIVWYSITTIGIKHTHPQSAEWHLQRKALELVSYTLLMSINMDQGASVHVSYLVSLWAKLLFPVVISFPLSSISRFDDFHEMTRLSEDSCQSLSTTTVRLHCWQAKLLSLSVFFNPSAIQSLTSSHAAFGFLNRSLIMITRAVIKLYVPLSFINGSPTLSSCW